MSRRVRVLIAVGALVAGVVAGIYAWRAYSPNVLGRHRAERIGDLSHGPAPREAFDRTLRAACGDGGITAYGRSAIARAPYVQRVTSTEVWLLWTSVSPATPRVEVTLPDGAPAVDRASAIDTSAPVPEGWQYVAVLGPLAPASTYCYQIYDPGGVLVARTAMRTAPPPKDARPVRFAALGDLGERTVDQAAVFEQLQSVELDFAVLTGDIAYSEGTLEQLETRFFATYAPMMASVPFFPASGNHDYKTDDAEPFRQAFALFENGGDEGRERWYSFDWGDVHVVVLDTQRVNATQAAWLDADLGASAAPWKVAVLHKPPFASGKHGSNAKVRDRFSPLFARHGVQLVLAGHDHHYERTVPIDGVTYVVTGGGGKGTRRVGSSDFTAFSAQVAHLTYIIVERDRLRLFAIDASGQLFDSALITL